ncbi:hypothetical protein [Brachyspira intermedia]|uniref:hypothetical protein n=1 Tax=Brachyspira intermedia TaxID=84377 RepID=UPI0030054925
MKQILKFIFNIEEERIYRKYTILGIKIITKPFNLKLLEEIKNLEYKINNIHSEDILTKLETYKIYSNYKKSNFRMDK